jgi:hypothetical protein
MRVHPRSGRRCDLELLSLTIAAMQIRRPEADPGTSVDSDFNSRPDDC